MTYGEGRPAHAQRGTGPTVSTPTDVLTVTDPANDLHAWSAVFLDDGRVISIGWLRGYDGAVEGRWRP